MRIVVKVGTSTLAHPGGLLNIRHTEDLVKVWSDIQNAGHQLIVVSSAATGLGAGKLQIEKPSDLVTKQAAAAVGQCELMYTYDRLFGQYNHTVAQMLLTWEDFDHENRLHNLQNTLERLLQLHAIPIINENDPVACEEYSLGDNDTLAALVAKCIHADLVVLMSDIDGLYTADPHTHPDEGHRRQACHRGRCGHDHYQRCPRRGVVRHCRGQARRHPVRGPQGIREV